MVSGEAPGGDEVLDMIYELLDIRLRKNPTGGLLQQICTSCLSLLKCFKSFKVITQRSQEICMKYTISKEAADFPTFEQLPSNFDHLEMMAREAETILEQSAQFSAEYFKTVCKQEDEVKQEIKAEEEIKSEDTEEHFDEAPSNDDDEDIVEDEKPKKVKYKTKQCEVCNKFMDGYEMKYHRNIHLKIYPFKCDFCERKFANPARLSSHKKSDHTDSEAELLPCDACGKSFSLKKLSDHQKKFHGEVYRCEFDECDENFPNYLKLSKHQKKAHFNPIHQKFTCEICGKAFRKTRLKYHMNIHLNIKPFVCDFEGCDKACPDPVISD